MKNPKLDAASRDDQINAELLLARLAKQEPFKRHMKHMRLKAKEKINTMVMTASWQALCVLGNAQLKQALIDQQAAEFVVGDHPFSVLDMPMVTAQVMVCLIRVEAARRGLVYPRPVMN